MQVLSQAMTASADSLQGWQLLSQLQLQNEQFDLAADSAAKGLKCLHQRRSRGYQSLPELAAATVLVRGHSLLSLKRPDDALTLFKALTGIVLCSVNSWPEVVPFGDREHHQLYLLTVKSSAESQACHPSQHNHNVNPP